MGAPRYTMVDLKDPKKQIPVAPKFFLGDDEALTHAVKAEKRLKLAARYVASSKNPWFAKAFVNRVWFCLMGEGFFNPVDDIGPTREADAPEVIDLLAKKWEATGYDIKWLFRTILNTKAYQRAARSTNTAAGRTAFASICPSRLRADQIYDAPHPRPRPRPDRRWRRVEDASPGDDQSCFGRPRKDGRPAQVGPGTPRSPRRWPTATASVARSTTPSGSIRRSRPIA